MLMAVKPYKVKQEIIWKWMGRPIEGHIEEVHLAPVTKLIKGKNIKRNGSPEKPAYLVKSKAGNFALKLHTELEAPTKASYKGPKPTMFD